MKRTDPNYDTLEEKKMDLAPVMSATPMSMLERAVASGASMEVLEKLMALQERWEKNQGRKAFDAAVATAKAKVKPVVKNRMAHNSKYADIAAIAAAVDPIISEAGLSYRFRAAQTDKAITVTCVLSHRDGHYEETSLSGPADTSGSKNAIQSIGSTLTYLQRYSLVLALGLAAAHDDDGNAASRPLGEIKAVSDLQVQEISDLLTDTKSDLVKFLARMKVESLTELRADKFEEIKQLIRSTAEKRQAKEALGAALAETKERAFDDIVKARKAVEKANAEANALRDKEEAQ
jgi:DNA-binding MarR family transcriptional regulator